MTWFVQQRALRLHRLKPQRQAEVKTLNQHRHGDSKDNICGLNSDNTVTTVTLLADCLPSICQAVMGSYGVTPTHPPRSLVAIASSRQPAASREPLSGTKSISMRLISQK